jgi:hypothetical protein
MGLFVAVMKIQKLPAQLVLAGELWDDLDGAR